MYDVLAALNIALIPLASVYLCCFIRLQYDRRMEAQSTPLSIFAWSMFFISLGIFISSIFYTLWDNDFIFKSTQYKLSLITRSVFIAGLIMSIEALDVKHKNKVIAGSLLVAALFYCAKVML